MMTFKKVELVSEIFVHLVPTENGIGVVLSPEKDNMYAEYKWSDIIDDLVEGYTVTVLENKDVRIAKDGKDLLLNIANKLHEESVRLRTRVNDMDVVD